MNNYQTIILSKTTATDKAPSVLRAYAVTADSLKQAYADAQAANADIPTDRLRVYPFCTPTDGNAQLAAAAYALYTYEKWERRNNNAVMESFKRSAADRNELVSIAALSINETFAANPTANMYDIQTAAFKAIANFQKKRDRNSEKEYHPDWQNCNLDPIVAKATFPMLDRLVRKAVETADLTDNQKQVLTMCMRGISAADIAEQANISRKNVYKTLYRVYNRILDRMGELDPTHRIMTHCGYTAADIENMQTILRKRIKA